MGRTPSSPEISDRLALLIADLEGGGAQRTMVTLANAFAGRGHPVDLLVVRAAGPLGERLDAGVRLLPLDGWLTRETTAALLLLYGALFLFGFGIPRPAERSGADIVEGPVDREYQQRELLIRDLNGFVLRFGQGVS